MKGGRLIVLGLLVLLALGTTIGLEWPKLHMAFVVWHIRRSRPEDLDAKLRALKGEEGRAVLEALAFSSEPANEATAPVRQRAFDELYRGHDIAGDEIARCIRQTRGLNRDRVALGFRLCTRESTGIRDAAIEALGEKDDLALAACRYLLLHGKDHETLVALRRAAWVSPIDNVRFVACRALGGMKEAENVPVLHHALADESVAVRLWAAETLAEAYEDPAGAQAAVNALAEHQEWAREILRTLHERRAVLELARFHDARRDSTTTLEVITGVELPHGASWTEWFEAHRAEFPPQLEASSLPREAREGRGGGPSVNQGR